MMRRKMAFVCLFFIATFLSSFSAHAQSANPQETLNQYISDLQKNPNDYALREKIIKLVQQMKQKPAISREAERFMNRGVAAVKSAKDANDFKDAVAEFEKATLSAPWLANAYYNLGVAQDKAGLYAAAIRSLKLYVLAEPNTPDIRFVEKLIDEIEYKQEKAAKESSPQAVASRKRQTEEEFIKKLNGAKFVRHEVSSLDLGGGCVGNLVQDVIYEIRGSEIIVGWINLSVPNCAQGYPDFRKGYHERADRLTINGDKFLIPREDTSCRIWGCRCSDEYGTITEDTLSVPRTCKGSTDVWVYKRRY